jgi:hypothetical protein
VPEFREEVINAGITGQTGCYQGSMHTPSLGLYFESEDRQATSDKSGRPPRISTQWQLFSTHKDVQPRGTLRDDGDQPPAL